MKKKLKKMRARLAYAKRRLRCIAKYRREGRDRRSGVVLVACQPMFVIGCDGVEAGQQVFSTGRQYRVTGYHRSDLTGGFVPIMDCDHDGRGGIRSPVFTMSMLHYGELRVSGPACNIRMGPDYTDFDDLAVFDETEPGEIAAYRRECATEDMDMEADGVAEWSHGPHNLSKRAR